MKKLIVHVVLLALVIGLLLSGCGNSAGNTPGGSTGTTEPIQLEAGKEIKISADGKVTAGDAVVSEGGAGSVATGCDITVKEDGTIIVATEEGDYAVCKNYKVTIPAKKEQVVQVSTPTGETLSTKGSGAAVGGITVMDTGAVQMTQGTVSKNEDKVVFSTQSGDYIIMPEGAHVKSTSTCQVQTPAGEIVQVQNEMTILDGKAKILANGTVATGEGAVSMLEETTTIATMDGVYTVATEEVVVAEETTVVLPVAVLNPAGEVISDGKAVISEGNISVTEEGNLLTSSGTVTVSETGVTVTPLEEKKTMTLPNGSVIDITNATTLEDGTVVLPEETISTPDGEFIGPERHYSTDGFLTSYDYYKGSIDADGVMNYYKASKNDPEVTHVDVFVYDLHYVTEPIVEHQMIERATNAVMELTISVLDNEGNVVEQEVWPLGSGEHSVIQYDKFGRETQLADYDADGNLQKSGIIAFTYLVESAHDHRYATITSFDIAGNKRTYEEMDANGNVAYAAHYYENGTLQSEQFFINGNLSAAKSYYLDGGYDFVQYNSDGSRIALITLPNGNYTITKYNEKEEMIRYQGFQADGSSLGYDEYSYNVDGWDSIRRSHKLKAQVFINQDGSVQGRLSMTELYDSVTQSMQIDYNEDGSVFGKFVTDKTTNTTYRYDGERLDSVVTNDDEGYALRSESYRYHADGTLMYKEVYDYQNNRYTRYDANGNILETFLIRS